MPGTTAKSVFKKIFFSIFKVIYINIWGARKKELKRLALEGLLS